jgi:hypothetical protein
MHFDNLDVLTETELLQIVRERLQQAIVDTSVITESLEQTLRELTKERGLQAVLENPEKFADLIEDLQLAELVREREDQDTIEVDIKEL